MIPSSETLNRAKTILETIEQLQAELASLFGGAAAGGARRGRPPGRRGPGRPPKALGALVAAEASGKRRKMSAEGRARIAAAAKARWAKFRADKKKTVAK